MDESSRRAAAPGAATVPVFGARIYILVGILSTMMIHSGITQ